MPAVTQPETVGNFRILSKLGQGGMGTVYRAIHGTLERPVALKILPAEFAHNTEYVMRFLREARTIAALRHDNVVQVYDAGEANGQYFIAMELVDGCNLLKHADEKGRIDPKEGLSLLLQAARGLAAAHAKGLVHRDIKPENLLLGKDNILRIVDFGLVMESSSTTQLTATGACLGTPMYMSPEQADGEQADARTDLYSLGVTFYRVFTGQAPFTSGTVMNLLFKHKFEAPPTPKSLRDDLPEDISNLILHLMAKRREDRPQTAQALIEMIETIKSGKHIPPPPVFIPSAPSTPSATLVMPQPSSRQIRPLPVLPLIGAAVVLVVALIVVLILLTGRSSGPGSASASNSADLSLKERGDAAYSKGRYAEALESYREALAETPDNAEIKARISRTERAMKFQDAMQKAKAAESKGDLDEAAARYTEAMGLDEGSTAKQQLTTVQERIKHNSLLDSTARQDEREEHSRAARDAEKSGNYEAAAEHYSRAAALSEGSTRSTFADKASECRWQQYLKQARDAEKGGDLNAALAMYQHALSVRPDQLVADKVVSLQKAIKEAEAAVEIDRRYRNAIDAGDAAVAKGEYRVARVHYGEAMGLKPQSSETTQKLNQLSKLEAQAATATTNSAGAAAAAAAQRKVLDLVSVNKDDEAQKEIMKALQANPNNADLLNTNDALKTLQFCSEVYAGLLKHLETASGKVRDLLDLDDDDTNGRFKTRLQKLRDQFADKPGKERRLLLDGNYDAVKAGVRSARADAKAAAEALSSIADSCDSRAEKYGEKVKASDPFGIVKVQLGGDSKKAEPYRKAAETFRKLASQAKELSN